MLCSNVWCDSKRERFRIFVLFFWVNKEYAVREQSNIMWGTFLFSLVSTNNLTWTFIEIRKLCHLQGLMSPTPLAYLWLFNLFFKINLHTRYFKTRAFIFFFFTYIFTKVSQVELNCKKNNPWLKLYFSESFYNIFNRLI